VPSIHYQSSKLQSQIKQLAVESNKKQLPTLQRSIQQVEAGRATYYGKNGVSLSYS